MKNPKPNKYDKSEDSRNETVDDAIEIAELVLEEATGIGAAKKIGLKVKRWISKEYISKIEYLENRQKEILDTNALLNKMCQDALKRIEELEDENLFLKSQLNNNAMPQNVTSRDGKLEADK